MNMNVRQLFKCAGSPPAQLRGESALVSDDVYVGVEVETESCAPLPTGLKFWKFEEEGSLKSEYGAEYVFAGPLKGAAIDAALTELHSALDNTGACYPVNTSVHVHIDVSTMTIYELRAFAYLSIVLEDALIRLSGNRWGNNFCLPYRSNPHALKWLGNTITNGQLHSDNSCKYAAVNFEPLRTYGTVEFRSHVGTHDSKEIMEWLNVLLNVRRFAIEMSKVGPADSVLSYVLSGKQLPEFLSAIWDDKTVRRAMHKDLHSNMCKASIAAQLGLYPKKTQDFNAWAAEVVGIEARPAVAKKQGPKYLDYSQIAAEHVVQQFMMPNQAVSPFAVPIDDCESDECDFDF